MINGGFDMASLRGRLAALEVAARRALDDRKLDLFLGALEGDPVLTAQFEELRGVVTGRLHELYDAIRQPLESEGEWPSTVSEIVEKRPDA
jgi:hypothetical protein